VFGHCAAARTAAAAGSATPFPPRRCRPANPSHRVAARPFLTAPAAGDAAVGSHSFVLRVDVPAPLATTGAAVGSYTSAAVPVGGRSTPSRWSSSNSCPADEGALGLLLPSLPLLRALGVYRGVATAALVAPRAGDTVAFGGPLGDLSDPLDAPGHVAVVVGGAGVSVGARLAHHVPRAASGATGRRGGGGCGCGRRQWQRRRRQQ